MKQQIIAAILSGSIFTSLLSAQPNNQLDSLLAQYAQQNATIDSLLKLSEKKINDLPKVEALARLYNTFLYSSPDLAERFARKELEVSEKIYYDQGIGWATYHLGAYFMNAGNHDSAQYYLKRSLVLHKKLGYHERYASVLTSLAFIEYTQGYYDPALEKYDEALAIYRDSSLYRYAIAQSNKANIYINKGFYKIALEETLGALRILDTVPNKALRIADAQRQVGYIEFLRENFETSLAYFQKAALVYEKENDKVFTASIYNDIGNVYNYLHDYERAIDYLEKSLALAKAHGISETEGNARSNLGKVYTKKGEYSKALDHLNTALKIHKANNFKANILWTQNDIGKTYLDMGQPAKAVPYLSWTIEQATGEGPINELKDAYNIRFQVFKSLGNADRAIEDQLMLQKLKDSIFNSRKTQQIEELRTIYETEKKDQQIAIQQNQITLLEQEAKINRLQRLLLGGGLGFSLLVFGIGFYGIRQKMKRNRLEREKVAAELAHKKKELTTHALHLAKKNEVLEGLKQKARELKSTESNKNGYQQLIRTIDFDLQDDDNWENFARYFEEVHKDFNGKVKRKFPDVTPNELRLLALLKMNLSSKEIANILNISQEGIKKARYRLRKKLKITTEDSLQDLVISL